MNKYTIKGRSARTGIQGFIGNIVTLVVGFVLVIWAVPGVPDAVYNYVVQNIVLILTSVGVGTGITSAIVSFIQNKFEASRGDY